MWLAPKRKRITVLCGKTASQGEGKGQGPRAKGQGRRAKGEGQRANAQCPTPKPQGPQAANLNTRRGGRVMSACRLSGRCRHCPSGARFREAGTRPALGRSRRSRARRVGVVRTPSAKRTNEPVVWRATRIAGRELAARIAPHAFRLRAATRRAKGQGRRAKGKGPRAKGAARGGRAMSACRRDSASATAAESEKCAAGAPAAQAPIRHCQSDHLDAQLIAHRLSHDPSRSGHRQVIAGGAFFRADSP